MARQKAAQQSPFPPQQTLFPKPPNGAAAQFVEERRGGRKQKAPVRLCPASLRTVEAVPRAYCAKATGGGAFSAWLPPVEATREVGLPSVAVLGGAQRTVARLTGEEER